MSPGPSLEAMIATVRADATSDDPRDQLTAASSAVAELEAVADALLGHFVDQCRRSGRSWSEISAALGVSKQAAHKRFSVDGQDPALRRFTPRARSVLRTATEAARSLGHGEVGTEHLLLGLFEPSGSIAAQVLSEAGITRAEVEGSIGDANAAPRASSTVEDPPFSPRAAAAIERAVTEALSLGHNYVGTEHLLLALFGDSEGLAAAILGDLGAQRDEFRKQILHKLAAYSGR
jgi:hypothetical protein